uniref:Putative methyltransferase n=1 Tax=viral metagenome TaxID=1070528 RepID=A0A6M3LJN5_9ZZZZ
MKPKPYYEEPGITIYHADCRDILPHLEPVDLILTDPPYGLNFMGKDWDRGVPGVHFWELILNASKPGCYLMAFGGTRTFHRLACAIEDAGWEIRDTVMWVYGSGFPKSLDVSKAIDKAGEWNAEFDEVRSWLRQKVQEKGLKHSEIDRAIGNENSHMASHFLGISQPMLPTWNQWIIIKALLGVDEDIERPPKCIGYERAIIGYRKVNPGLAFTSIGPAELPVTLPASEAAKQWEGWGTALKPAWEPIIIARKPIEGTVAQNVLKYGTGALNIGECRVPGIPRLTGTKNPDARAGSGAAYLGSNGSKQMAYDANPPSGRFPANLIHDGSEEVVGLFPNVKAGGSRANTQRGQIFVHGGEHETYGDSGSAARFYYCAKASRSERGEGNTHPTVKPIALLQYLIKLGLPPGGVVLDPFAGSGSTLVTAQKMGCKAIGIELGKENNDIAIERRRQGVFDLRTAEAKALKGE